MQSSNNRPLTRHENQMRLLFMHADEVIQKLEVLNYSVDKLDRLDVMINGVVGAPGLIEVVESLAFGIARVERLSGQVSSREVRDIADRLMRIESLMTDNNRPIEDEEKDTMSVVVAVAKVTAFMWGVSVMTILHISLAHGVP